MAAQRTGSGTRKARLDTDRIVAAGLEVAREERQNTLAAKSLGAKLGVDPSAVYRHFRNKEDLMAALLDALYSRALARLETPQEEWEARLVELASEMLAEFVSHPAVACEAMTITTHGPGEYAFIETILGALSRTGLDDARVVEHYALISSHILSMASGIARDRTGYDDEDRWSMPDERDPESGMPWHYGPILADAHAHPNISRYAQHLSELRDREIYLLGVTTLLDAARRAAPQTGEARAAS